MTFYSFFRRLGPILGIDVHLFVERVELGLHEIAAFGGQLVDRLNGQAASLHGLKDTYFDMTVQVELSLFLVVEVQIGRGDHADERYLRLDGHVEGAFLERQQLGLDTARAFGKHPDSELKRDKLVSGHSSPSMQLLSEPVLRFRG